MSLKRKDTYLKIFYSIGSIHLFKKCLLSTYYVLGTIQAPRIQKFNRQKFQPHAAQIQVLTSQILSYVTPSVNAVLLLWNISFLRGKKNMKKFFCLYFPFKNCEKKIKKKIYQNISINSKCEIFTVYLELQSQKNNLVTSFEFCAKNIWKKHSCKHSLLQKLW